MDQDKIVGLIGLIIVLPVTIYFIISRRKNVNIIFFCIAFIFLKGSIELLTGADLYLFKLIIEIVLYIQFIRLTILRKYIGTEGIFLVLIIIISLMSYIINKSDYLNLLAFLRRITLPLVVIAISRGKEYKIAQTEMLINYIVAMLVCQIFVNLLRIPITGLTEYYIGSISKLGGSLTLLISLSGAAIFLSNYLYRKKLYDLLATFAFFTFGVVGQKRAILFFMPMLIILANLFELIRRQSSNYIFKIIRGGIISAIIILFSIKFFPDLNPDHKIWGSIDISYTLNYIKEYLFPERAVKGIPFYGRGDALIGLYQFAKDSNLSSLLFGTGPGNIMPFKNDIFSSMGIKSIEDLIAYKFGIGYGARVGIVFVYLQIGVIGSVIFFCLFISYIIEAFIYYLKMKKNQFNPYLLSYLLILIILSFDFIYYSYSLFTLEAVPLIFLCFSLFKYFWEKIENSLYINKS